MCIQDIWHDVPIFHFFVRDHLGSVRQVVNAAGEVEQSTDYYPFGGILPTSTCQDLQRYKYNGKELDRMNGLDWMYYGARCYDAALGRWNGPDALAEKNYGVSAYAFCGNNPLIRVDMDGKTDYYVNENGDFYKHESLWQQIKSMLCFWNDRKDNVFKQEDGRLLSTYPEGTIKDVESGNHVSFEVQDYNYADDLFGKLIVNTNVEWGMVSYKKENTKGTLFFNDHKQEELVTAKDKVREMEIQGKNIIEFRHSHPIPSNCEYSNMKDFMHLNPSSFDMDFARHHPSIVYKVYNLYKHKIQYYDANGIYQQKRFSLYDGCVAIDVFVL